MDFTEILKMRDFDINRKIKLVRHQDSSYDLKRLYREGMLEFFQSLQSKDVFGNCDYIFSFIGEEGKKATFIGAYRRGNVTQFDQRIHKIPENFPYYEFLNQPLFHYEFHKLSFLEDLIDRLVIDWSSRIWYQWLKDENSKQVIEILPQGYVKDFPGFDELLLTYDELKRIIKNPDANRVWHTMLSSVAGIYLIVDMTDGRQYIGSASGKNGLLGRWIDYAENPHGNNEELRRVLQNSPLQYKNFRFSILRTLSKSLTIGEIIRYEQIYKQKLGSQAFGLNRN